MNLYLKVLNNEIIAVNTEKINCDYEGKIVNSIKDLDRYIISEEMEAIIQNIIEPEIDHIQLSSFNIKHWVSNRSFGELIDMFESGEIIKPDMQRDFVWDSIKCSRLIESIVLGLPITPLFLLEIDTNKYELIDGLQRLTALTNYVTGKPWYSANNSATTNRQIAAKLSSKIADDIAGKTFGQLSDDFKRIIKRSTIPLIEFKQLDPDNFDSKYLIFERINTGSEKLNPMQIRKALAYGSFIKSLYENTNIIPDFLKLFSNNSIKKDSHIEAFLRIIVMSDIVFKRFEPNTLGINHILNEYCETHKNNIIEKDYLEKFKRALTFCYETFSQPSDMFKRVEIDSTQNYHFEGNMNISILESFLG